jgi:hypothetical protein
MSSRAHPSDLSDIQPAKKTAAPTQAIRETSEVEGFVSRSVTAPTHTKDGRPIRRRRTGRNVQLNLKVTAQTAQRFGEIADALDVPFGKLLDLALDALEGKEQWTRGDEDQRIFSEDRVSPAEGLPICQNGPGRRGEK